MDFDGWLLGRLDAVKRDGLYRTLRTQETALKTKGQKRQTWASNDYLGLSKDERLITAAQTALSRFGAGSGGSRLTTGNTVWHEKLEQKISDFKQTEAALLFSSGYLANIGVLASLPQKGDVILSDQLNHASIVDGCRLSKAETIVYRHIDMADLEKKLASVQTRNRRFIVTDGVFSMDGTIAPLDRIMPLAKQYQAFVIADDAHATGILGENGGGTSDYFGVCPDVVIGTLSKAVGTEGGFAAGSNIFIDFLLNQARTFIFQTALPPSICAASHTAFDLISDMHDTRRELQSSVKKIKTRLADMGFTVRGGDTPIIPVIIGDAKTAVSAAALLEKKGICAPAIRPPAVPEGESRIRLTVTADRSLQDIDELTEAFDSIRKELNINK
ncbi:8-amino-7-oxononanoate synthase [Bacillus amyloliquefaciens]|uniref:8-amino-7-ketopelargonate synthase n=1 Tax=Bacillus velezensis TaxID=492670 RepID=A0A6A8LD57_BACVE|nr:MULTISPECIES: 8-amino-7-oxononanoate synthase [Bacillus]COD30993.1 8-amino-7-oxononanoate synthase [Streptococcus pneumoniae]ASZ03676.1 8-amino-7-oxononanoate synthase [Bacillus velezensis]MCB5335135.1 8-amino-7-oxononanoate synthase 2 [Bacillus amyloliquefaciens]MCC5594885.1 8-amino-7-oxononanoate synthase [Bacillus velezensis]MDK4204474.1 8-amino-7-oxononanoate synthase [Bacillus velezensis]